MKNYIIESADDIRRYIIRKYNWGEKNGALDSAGNINGNFSDILIDLFDDFHSGGKNSNCIGKFTSGNDSFHKNKKSNHPLGLAVDITLPENCHSGFTDLLKKYKSRYKGFSFIDEYKNPSKYSTGGHFHISYTPTSLPRQNNKPKSTTDYSTKNKSTYTPNKQSSTDPALAKLVGAGIGIGMLSKALNNESEAIIYKVLTEYVNEKKLR